MKAREFFDPIVQNINKLQRDGLSINGKILKFSFSTIVADNLAAHLLGGFQCSFNHGYFCRRCFITNADKAIPFNELKVEARTIAYHDELVGKIIANSSRSSLMGVVGASPILGLIDFHPITSLAGDIMHDFIEGVCPIVIMRLLKQASSLRILTYGERNFFLILTINRMKKRIV